MKLTVYNAVIISNFKDSFGEVYDVQTVLCPRCYDTHTPKVGECNCTSAYTTWGSPENPITEPCEYCGKVGAGRALTECPRSNIRYHWGNK